MNIIGITGKAGCGKDSAAEALGRFSYSKFQFSAPLKRGLAVMFGWTVADLSGEAREWRERPVNFNGVDIPSPRHMLQTLGTDWGRNLINPDLWVMLAANDVLRSGASRVVFTDLRFENEAAWIRNQGGIIVHLYRPGQGVIATSEHSSEHGIGIIPEDYIIINDGTIQSLQQKIEAIAREQLGLDSY